MTTWWIPLVVAFISLLGVIVVPVLTSRRTQRLNDEQLRGLELKRKLADDDRNEELRDRWQATTQDVDYLWSLLQDEIGPWMRSAYEIIHVERPDFPRPPTIRPRPDREERDRQDRELMQVRNREDDDILAQQQANARQRQAEDQTLKTTRQSEDQER
jgi:hypothetical protein